MDSSDKEIQFQDPKTTICKIQQGDLEFKNQIQNGILFVGDTKVGKTTCCHYLMGHALKSIENDAGNIVYTLKRGSEQYSKAKIGINQSQSETQIPNIFHLQIPQLKNLALIDSPGYGDSNGCSFKISNGYFHFKIFSLVKNLRLTYIIQFNDLKGKATKLKSSFTSFISSFSKYNDIQQDILNASFMIINKVPRNFSLQKTIQKFRSFKNPFKAGDMNQFYENFKENILKDNKIIIINSPQKVQEGTNGNFELVKEINTKTVPWCRQIDQKTNYPTMKNIRTCIKKDLISPKQQDEIQQTQKYLQKMRIFFEQVFFKNIELLQKFFKIFIRQSFSNKNIEQCISLIKNEFNVDTLQFQGGLRQQREAVIEKMFKIQQQGNSENLKKPLWLSKIKVSQKIEKIAANLSVCDNFYDVQVISQIKKAIYGILLDIIKLLKKKNRELVIKFSYYILKIIQITTSFYQIMKQDKAAEGQQAQMLGFILSDYPCKITQLMKGLFDQTLLKKKIVFIQKNDITKLNEGITDTSYIADFFQNLLQQVQSPENQNLLVSTGLNIELINDMLKFVKQKNIEQQITSIFKNIQSQDLKNPNLLELGQNHTKLAQIILLIDNLAKDSSRDLNAKQKLKFFKTRSLHLIGKCLLKMGQLEQAQVITQFIGDVYHTKQILFLQQKKKMSDLQRGQIKKSQLIEFYLKFMQAMIKFNDLEEAKRIGLKNYHLCLQLGVMQSYFTIEKLMQKIYSIQKSQCDYFGQVNYFGGPNFDILLSFPEEVQNIINKKY